MINLRIYLASSWRNPYHTGVLSALRGIGYEVYDFKNPKPGNHGFGWAEIDPNWENWSPRAYRRGVEHPVAKAHFRHDWDAMNWANTGVLLLPCGKDAHIEAGYLAGAGRRIFILLADPDQPAAELMYSIAWETRGDICVTLNELIHALEAYHKELREPHP